MFPVKSLFGESGDVLRDSNLQVLLLANTVGPLGLALISPILNTLKEPYAVTDAQIGLMMTAFTAPAILVIPVAGILTDRYGRKPFLIGGLILFSVTGSALALITDFSTVLGLRFLQGIGAAAVTPVIVTSIGDLYSGASEAAGQGFRVSVAGLTQGFFPILGGFLVVIAWQFPLALYFIGIPVAIVVASFLEEPATSAHSTGENRTVYIRELLSLLVKIRVTAIIIVRMIPIFLLFTFTTYVSLLVAQTMQGTPEQAGILVGLASMMYAVAATQVGRAGPSFEARILPIAAAHVFMTIGIVVVALAPSVLVAIPGGLLFGAGFGISISLLRSVVTGFAPTEFRGGLVSLSESSGWLAATIAPIIVGLSLQWVGPVGSVSALQVIILIVTIASGLVAIVCLGIAKVAPPVSSHFNGVTSSDF